jgi:inorganic triphosphatase YgiF
MPNEIEIKLTLTPSSLRRLEAQPWLRKLVAGGTKPQELISVYYDTSKYYLHDRDVSLRVRRAGNKHLQTIKASGAGAPFARKEWEEEIFSDKPDFALAKKTALKPLLSKTVKRKLKPVFETRVQRTAIPVHIGESVIELAIDRGTVKTTRRSQPISEVELELKQSDPAALCKLARRITKVVPVRYGVASKPERGYVLAAGKDVEAAHADAIEIDEHADVAGAFKAIGLSCLRHLARNEEPVREGDAEGIHQMRVGLRRLRAALSLFKNIVQDPQTERLKTDLKWLTEQLGPARDYDVFVKESIAPLESMPRKMGVGALKADLRKRRADGFAKARSAVNSGRYRQIVLDIVLWLAGGAWTKNPDPLRKGLRTQPVNAFAREVLDQRTKKIVKKIKKLESLDARHRHKLRIAIKKLRYATEFFSSLFADAKKERKKFGKELEKLQRSLGTLNDIRVHEGLADEIVRVPKLRAKGRQTAFAVGLVSGQEQKDVEPLLGAAMKAGNRLAAFPRYWR